MAGPLLTQVAESTPFDNGTNEWDAENVQAALEESFAVSAYADFSPWSAENGTSDPIPFMNTEFETHASMHDPTIGDSGTATGTQTSTTLQDTSQSWTVNQFAGHIVKLSGGTGSGQWRTISSNTSDTLTVASAWGTTPVAASTTYDITELADRLTAPVDGYYQVTGHASMDYQASLLGVFFYVNGSFKSLHYTHQGQTVEINGQHTRLMFLNKDDYVQMAVYNGNSAHQNMFGGSARLFFQMARMK